MTQAQQPEALRLAEILEQYALNPLREVAAELRRQHARIEELEAQLSAIGAGGVEPLRKPASVAASERELFEAVASDSGKWPKAIERDAKGNYLLLTTANGWMWWREARRAPAWPQPPDAMQSNDWQHASATAACWCETCDTAANGWRTKMALCPQCGNKRCPRAAHHDNACTGSNEPGQKGSSWEHVRPAPKAQGEQG